MGLGSRAMGLPLNPDFWAGRRVLLTGHTGFKGAWAAAVLAGLGARVTGFALAPEGEPNLWRLFAGRLPVAGVIGDLREPAAIAEACRAAPPQIVIHMAAQALVRRGYECPVETFATNVGGTAHLLEALRGTEGVEAILVVTSDKVYRNTGAGTPFRETDALGGSDPYSGSKAAAELVARAYAESYFAPRGVPLATARGGNVLGGGDFASDRLVPDVVRATKAGTGVVLRYPDARRPWQHVLDCVAGYLRYVEHLHGKRAAEPAALNFGPLDGAEPTVAAVAELVGRRLGNAHAWQQASGDNPPEQPVLRLDCRLARQALGWSPRLDTAATLEWTAEWYAEHARGGDALALVSAQISRYAQAGS